MGQYSLRSTDVMWSRGRLSLSNLHTQPSHMRNMADDGDDDLAAAATSVLSALTTWTSDQ